MDTLPHADDRAVVPESADETDVTEEEAPTAPEPTYTVQVSSGLLHYVCLACGASMMDLDPMHLHLRLDHNLVPFPARTEPPDAAEADPADPAPTYVEQSWSGLPQYVCLTCGTSMLDRGQMTTHLRLKHGLDPRVLVPEPPPVPMAVDTPGLQDQDAPVVADDLRSASDEEAV